MACRTKKSSPLDRPGQSHAQCAPSFSSPGISGGGWEGVLSQGKLVFVRPPPLPSPGNTGGGGKNLLQPAIALLLALALAAPCLAAKINYADNALPIFRNECMGCHNPDKKKAGLDLSTFQSAMAGSSDGPVINPGDADGSLLYRVITHADEPTMPPKRDKLPDSELNVIKQWILAGALATANGKAPLAKKPKIDLSFSAPAGHRPDGPPPMPHDMLLEPVIHAARPGAISALAASPWAPLVAVSGQHQVLLYNPDTLALLGVIPFTDGQPQTLSFSASGRLLLIGGGEGAKSGKVVLWDIVSGARVTDVGNEFDAVLAADITPDQSRVALGGPGKVLKVYSTKDGSLIDAVKVHTDWVTAVGYSPDGVLLASGDRAGGLRVWEARTDREFYTLDGHKGGITAVAFRGDSNILASASEDGTIKLWDMNSGNLARTIQAHPGGVLSVAFAADGRIVSAGRDRLVRIWRPDGSPDKQLDGFDDIALHAIFSDDGKRIIAGDFTGAVRVWNTTDGKPAGTLDANPLPLSQRIDVATAAIPAVQASAEQAAADLTAARPQLAAAEQSLQAVQSALDAARQAVADARNRLAAEKACVPSAATALAAARDDLKNKQADAVRLSQLQQQAKAAREQAAAAAESAHAAVASRQKAVDAAVAALAAAKTASSSTTTQPSVAVQQAQATFERANQDLAAAKDADTAAAAQLAKQVDALAAATAQVTQATAAVATAQHHVSQCETAEIQITRRIAADQVALVKANAAAADAENQLPPHRLAVEAAKVKLARFQAASDSAATAFVNTRSEILRLKAGQYFLTVYAARAEVADRQQQRDQMADALTAAQAAADKANADVAAAEKSLADAPNRLRARQAAIDQAKSALTAANAAVAAAQGVVSRKESLLHDAQELAGEIKTAASSNPDDKALAEAVAKAGAAADALTADVNAAQQMANAKAAAAKSVTDTVAAATAALAREQADIDAAPKAVASLKVIAATATADVPAKKAALDEAVATLNAVKSRADELNANYQKLTQDASLSPAASPPGKT